MPNKQSENGPASHAMSQRLLARLTFCAFQEGRITGPRRHPAQQGAGAVRSWPDADVHSCNGWWKETAGYKEKNGKNYTHLSSKKYRKYENVETYPEVRQTWSWLHRVPYHHRRDSGETQRGSTLSFHNAIHATAIHRSTAAQIQAPNLTCAAGYVE